MMTKANECNAEATTVVFRMWRIDGQDELIALFPYAPASPCLVESYQCIGQHGDADYGRIVAHSRPATEDEYRNLKRELECIGYKLIVRQRANRNRMSNAWRE